MSKIHGLTAAQWMERINSSEAKDWPRNIGHDKGFSPSAYVFLVYDPEKDVLIAAKELVLRGYINEHEVQSLIEANKTFTHPFTTCTDPPDHPKDTDAMNHYSEEHKAGIYFSILGRDDKQEKDVLWGIGLVTNFIAKGKFVVIGSECLELVECLQTYHLKESNAKLGPDKTTDDTHLPDGLRYGVVGMQFQIEIARIKAAKRKPPTKPAYPYAIPPPEPEKKKKGGITVKPIKVKKMIHIGLR